MGLGRVRAAIFVAAAILFCGLCVTPRPAWGDDDDEAHLMLFSGRDLWGNGLFMYGGMMLAPSGFEQDGLMLKLYYSTGAYRYNAGDLGGEQVVGLEWLGAVMPGFRIKRGPVEMKIFFGPEFESHHLWPDDPGNVLRGHTLGLRFAAELWAEPTASTMIAGDTSLTSAGSNYAARLAYGMQVLEQFYAGPESQVYGGDGYAQWRFGLHITSMKTGVDTEWSAAIGFAMDSDRRTGPYVRLGVTRKIY